MNKLFQLLEHRSKNGIELHVKEFETRGTRIEIENSRYNLAGFDQFKSEILAELKRVKYKDLRDLVFRIELTYDESVDILDIKNNAGATNGYKLPPGRYEITDINLMLKSLFSDEKKVNITIDDIKLGSNLTSDKLY